MNLMKDPIMAVLMVTDSRTKNYDQIMVENF